MSRTTQGEILESPCTKFLKYKTFKEILTLDDGTEVEKIGKGAFCYYDKELKKDIPVEAPFKFAILNPDLVSYKGYDEKMKRGVWSNEVRDPEHEVVIKGKDVGALLTFKKKDYKDLKERINGLGAKYTQSVYIAVEGDNGLEIWNLQLSGAALTGGVDKENMKPEDKNDGWFSFLKVAGRIKMYDNWIVVDSYKVKKKGTNKFAVPVYTLGDKIDAATGEELNALDTQLKAYLDYYFKKKPAVETTDADAEVDETEEVVSKGNSEIDEDLPF